MFLLRIEWPSHSRKVSSVCSGKLHSWCKTNKTFHSLSLTKNESMQYSLKHFYFMSAQNVFKNVTMFCSFDEYKITSIFWLRVSYTMYIWPKRNSDYAKGFSYHTALVASKEPRQEQLLPRFFCANDKAVKLCQHIWPLSRWASGAKNGQPVCALTKGLTVCVDSFISDYSLLWLTSSLRELVL